MRHHRSRLVEERVVCDPDLLEETVKQNLGSDRSFATYLGVGRGTARGYRLGRYTLPRSFFERLQLLNPALRPRMVTDAFWGQRKGGTLRVVGRKSSHVATNCCKSHCHDSHDERFGHDRAGPVGPGDIAAYSAVPPSLTLQAALSEPIIAPTYSASEIESQKRMQSLEAELFGYNPETKLAKGNHRMQLRRVCGRTINLLGIPFGRKTVTNPGVPAFIMESDEPEVWLSFLRGIFDDEAYVSERGIEMGLAVRQATHHSFSNNSTGSRILDDVSELLRRLEVQHVRRMGQVYRVGRTHAICWFLRIPRREFRKVQDLGLFLLPQKQRRLIAAL